MLYPKIPFPCVLFTFNLSLHFALSQFLPFHFIFYRNITTPVCGFFASILLALRSPVPERRDESVNQTSASPALIFIPQLCHQRPFIPHTADMPRFPLSISSPPFCHLLPPHLSSWFPFYHHLLLHCSPFIHGLSVSPSAAHLLQLLQF